MANVRSGNTFFIDGTSASLDVKGIRVSHIEVTSTNTGAVLVLSDVTTASTKIKLAIAADKTVLFLDFSDNPMVFPNGINPSTVTNCVATLMLQESRG
jgi:hypothetical protein